VPIRGETIGRAYVRILADGSGFDQDVKRQLREHEQMFEHEGQRAGQAWMDGYEAERKKGLEDDDNFFDRIRKGAGRLDAVGEQYAEHFTHGFREELRQHFGDDIGDMIGKNLDESFLKGASLQSIAARLENIRPDVARATQQIVDEQNRIWAKGNADNEKDYELHIAKLARMDQLREGSAKIHAQQLKEVDNQYRALSNDVGKFSDGVNKNRESFRELNARIESVSNEMAVLGATSKDTAKGFEDLRRTLRGQGNDVDRANKKYGTFGDTLGKMFGKGARNNFVNAIGSIMEGVGNLASVPQRVFDKFKGMGDSLGLVFDQAGGGVGGFIAVAGRISTVVGGAAVGLIALVGVVGTLTTALLLAAGAALALVSALGFGLIGALAPLVGLLGPVGVALGGVALAFATMTKEQRKATLKPFTDGLKKLGSLALPGIMGGLNDAFDRLRKPQGEGTIKLFQRVEHLATAAGVAVGKFLSNFAIGIRGAGLGQFIGTMTTTLPRTMARVGRILGNTFEGFLGILSTLNQPGGPVDTLLNSLNELTKGFGTWSVSPQAVQFFKNAQESAGALLDLIRPLWDLLSKILNAGRGAGNNMFSEMGKAVQGWSDALSKRDLKTFFDDAQKMGEAIGNVVVQIGHLIAALDDPTTRQFAIGAVNGFAKLVEVVALLVGWFGGLNEQIQLTALAFGTAMVAGGLFATKIASSGMFKFAGDAFSATNNLTFLGRKLDESSSKMDKFKASAATAGGIAGLGLLADGASHADRSLSVLEDAAGGAAIGFAAGGPLGAALGGAGGMLFGLGNRFLNAGDKAKDAYQKMREFSPVQAAIANLEDLKSTLDDVTGSYTGATRAAVLNKLQTTGALEIGKQFGLTAREMVNSLLGQSGAFAKLRPVFQQYGTQIDNVKQKQQEMIDQAMSAQFGPKTAADARKMLLGGFGDPNEAFIALENQRKGLEAKRLELEKLPGVLRKDAREIQNNSRITQELTGKLKGIPKKIQTKIEDVGILPTTRGVAQIARRYKLLDGKKIKTLISASGADTTVRAVQRVIKKLDEAQKKKTEPKIGANTKPADTAIANTLKKLGFVGKFLAQPSILLDITKFNTNNNDVKKKVDDTGKLNPQIKVDAQTQQASQDLTGIKTQVDNLPSSKTVTITVNTVRRGGGQGPATASGGIFAGAQNRLIGESGPEAVVPLSRPLYMVDPAVRELAAFARGKMTASGSGGVTTGPITIITPTKDPIAVAQQVVNRIAAASYI